eukprot:1155445-Pelagomonas_calceolata.AAC.1
MRGMRNSSIFGWECTPVMISDFFVEISWMKSGAVSPGTSFLNQFFGLDRFSLSVGVDPA